ncbi:MAG: peptidyl-tRNA hydrolase Pth2 [Thermoplasmata archaeon]
MDYKLVIVVRDDLTLSKGKLAAQVAHASVECAIKAKDKIPDVFRGWYREGQKKVVLKVKNEKELFLLKEKAESIGFVTALITDAGLTEVPPGTVTCLGIGPDKEEFLDKITSSLPLL